MRGDRKYRRVCTLGSRIRNSRFAGFSRPPRSFASPRDRKKKRGKRARYRTLSIFAERARVHACTREFLIIRAVDVIDDTPGAGKNTRGTYASRNLTRMTMRRMSTKRESASLLTLRWQDKPCEFSWQLSDRSKSCRIISVEPSRNSEKKISKEPFDQSDIMQKEQLEWCL